MVSTVVVRSGTASFLAAVFCVPCVHLPDFFLGNDGKVYDARRA
jgi:hypothetical protein